MPQDPRSRMSSGLGLMCPAQLPLRLDGGGKGGDEMRRRELPQVDETKWKKRVVGTSL